MNGMGGLANPEDLVLVTGAGGFIGGHLVAELRAQGFANLRAVDVKPLDRWYQRFDDVDNRRLDLRERADCEAACRDATYVFNFASDMGGMGFIENHKALCMLSVLINTHLLQAAVECGVQRYFYASSACVYAADKQNRTYDVALKEGDAYPAMPEDGYGWEKLFSERMCRHFFEDCGLETRVVRYHNVYGPYGPFDGGREKAPAAICRKVATARLSGRHEIEIWGDGEQTRSFMYIDDCLHGTQMLMAGGYRDPINLGGAEMVSINRLVDLVEDIAGVRLERAYDLDAPRGVRGRCSDNTLIRSIYGWEPGTRLRDGLERTYAWIYDELVHGRSASIFTEHDYRRVS